VPVNLIDVITSLTLIMTEETERLKARDREDLTELATVKIRLTGVLEGDLARLNREQPGWADALEGDVREALSSSLIALGEASAANAAVLERQIDLSIELMAALAAEARRLSKKRAETYGSTGLLSPIDLATPISVNSQF
jgi:hypothetical protein